MSAWLFTVVTLGAGFLIFLYLTAPPNEVVPVVTTAIASFGEQVPLAILVIGAMSLVGAVICFAVSPLQNANYKRLEHDFMMKEVERLVPLAVERLHADIAERNARLTVFARLVTDLTTEVPKLKREYAELVAGIATLAYDKVEKLDVETKVLTNVITHHEDTTALTVDTVARIRDELGHLSTRTMRLLEANGDVSLQAKHLLDDVAVMQSKLQAIVTPSNVLQLRPAE